MGTITQGDGKGWDGQAYAWLLEGRHPERTTSARLRAAVVALNAPAFAVTNDAVKAFRVMNLVYCAILILALLLLADAYGADALIRTYLALTVSVCIALVQMHAFYPVQVDLGACAIITVALYCAVRGFRLATACAMLLSVVSREFAVAAVLFGIHRDVRQRAPVRTTAMTYVPALLLYLAWRNFVGIDATNASLLSAPAMLQNVRLWADPVFAAFFIYFSVTIFGGLTMGLVSDPFRVARLFRREPEWLTYSILIVGAAAVGNADIWRYLAFLAPVVAVLLAAVARQWTAPEKAWLLACGAALTWFTQAPFRSMDLERYFQEWFPYYVWADLVHDVAAPLWPLWTWRFLVVVVAIWLMSSVARALRDRTPDRL